jgi:hypothetical protein
MILREASREKQRLMAETPQRESQDEQPNLYQVEHSLGERIRYMKFLINLDEAELRTLNQVTKGLPLDPSAGLMSTAGKVWQRRTQNLHFAATIGRMALNLFAVCYSASMALQHDVYFSASGISLQQHFVSVCNANMVHDEGHTDCFKSSLQRLNAYRLIVAVELCVVSGSVLIYFICVFSYVCGRKACASNNPACFMILPRFAARFSSILFLQFANFNRASSLVFRGEGKLMWCLTFGQQPSKNCSESVRILLRAISAIFLACMVMFSFQALLVKLTVVHFASVTSFTSWSTMQWVVFISFMNQLAGICASEEIELRRVLLMKFGGTSVQWDLWQCEECVSYLRLFTSKLAQSLGTLDSLAAMATFSSIEVQKLLFFDKGGGAESHFRRFAPRIATRCFCG